MIPCNMYVCRLCHVVYLVPEDEIQDECAICGGQPEFHGMMLDVMDDVRLLEGKYSKES